MKLGLRAANQQFSKAIKAVRAGKEVVLTDRGRPIAVIKPIRDAESQDTRLQAMADEGLIRRPSRAGLTPAPRWRPVRLEGPPLSQTVMSDREDRVSP
ncbi:MAG TPA: type II toxin-antitoxin system prevent-host-death family antitoxin [Vicinamibacterales bacterium]|nr:type II toxin-antitoxin system prevent-host-death family antitoxin [Vicinamibacterales bacterium]